MPTRYCFFLLTLFATSDKEILIFGYVLSCAGSDSNKVTYDVRADINNELTSMKQISVGQMLTVCSSSKIVSPDAHTVMSSA